ncbi:expressed protein [Phakopsora pachyrhizi]|uniref:Expressed protein n=1 Tax=Phakopsora pachyrhizi TaxID=170000 RepID=A0AAV0BIQ3_PHAPC|nr:expressed protein [Phakopsora pachyrhizi]
MTDRQDLSHSGCNPTTPTGGDDRSRLISTLHFLGPVTALETVDCQPRPFGSQRLVVLLVGSGPYLSIYQMRSSSSPIDRNLIIRTKVFDYHRIHHITHSRPSNGSTTLTASHLSWQVICFGGDRFSISTIKVIDLDGTSRDSDDELTGPRVLVQKFRSFKATDSIVDALIINQDRNPATLIVLLTSHNQLVLYSYVDETQTLSKVSLLSSADRSLLSSGKILLTDEGDHDCEDFIVRKLKLFSGSIPGSILFWESELIYRRTNSGDRFELIDSCSKPISLCGHKGPVHDISVSRCGRRLASASEDRSIRVWDLKYVSSNPIVLWGHLGRAWRLRWKDDNILTSVAELFLGLPSFIMELKV